MIFTQREIFSPLLVSRLVTPAVYRQIKYGIFQEITDGVYTPINAVSSDILQVDLIHSHLARVSDRFEVAYEVALGIE